MPHRIVVIHDNQVFPKTLHVKAGHTLQFHSNEADFHLAFDRAAPIAATGEQGHSGVAGPIHTINGAPGTYSYTVTIGNNPIDPEIIVDPGN